MKNKLFSFGLIGVFSLLGLNMNHAMDNYGMEDLSPEQVFFYESSGDRKTYEYRKVNCYDRVTLYAKADGCVYYFGKKVACGLSGSVEYEYTVSGKNEACAEVLNGQYLDCNGRQVACIPEETSR